MGTGLNALEIVVLRGLARGHSLGEITRSAGATPGGVGKAIASLQMNGFVGDDGKLTPKGNEAAKSD